MRKTDASKLQFSADKKTLFFGFDDFLDGVNNDGISENYGGENSSSKIICGMTLKSAGSMRFRWNEKNPLRDRYFYGKNAVAVEQIHSKIVWDVSESEDVYEKKGDGIITKNRGLVPTVTVADCMPIFLWEPESEVFGIVHSGWKGTGIAVEAMKKAWEKYGSKTENFKVILGPHIESCCYIVNEERAMYFCSNFGEECVTPLEKDGKCYAGGRGLPVVWDNGGGPLFRLSLEKANVHALKNAGVKDENITVITDCTCCNEIFGSNRRETAESPFAADKSRCFTVQAAFIYRR